MCPSRKVNSYHLNWFKHQNIMRKTKSKKISLLFKHVGRQLLTLTNGAVHIWGCHPHGRTVWKSSGTSAIFIMTKDSSSAPDAWKFDCVEQDVIVRLVYRGPLIACVCLCVSVFVWPMLSSNKARPSGSYSDITHHNASLYHTHTHTCT